MVKEKTTMMINLKNEQDILIDQLEYTTSIEERIFYTACKHFVFLLCSMFINLESFS